MTSHRAVDGIEISSDPDRIDVALVHRFLSNSYWARDRPLADVEKSIRYSLSFGAYAGPRQVAFARVITDRAVFAYLADVFVVAEFRGRGIAKMLLEAVLRHPDLQGIRLYRLATQDAHGLYEKFGFARMFDSERSMELFADET